MAETNAEQDIQDDLRISDIEELEPEASEQNSEITELEMPELEDIELEALNIEENGADARHFIILQTQFFVCIYIWYLYIQRIVLLRQLRMRLFQIF